MSRPGPDVPDGLAAMQQAFADSIRTPLHIHADGYDYRTDDYDPKTVASMVPSPELSGIQRLSTYNQQYWFRLLTVLQGELPLLRHRLGVTVFNHLASDYLDTYPSAHPELHHLPERLLHFMAEHERWSDPLLRQCAELDLIYSRVFFAAKNHDFDGRHLSDEQMQALLTRPIPFQSAWFLFAEEWNLVALRKLIAHDDDDEISLPDPELDQGHWVIYRGHQGIAEELLGPVQYRLLAALHDGASLTEACELMTTVCNEAELAHLGQHIQSWFARWASLGWFAAD